MSSEARKKRASRLPAEVAQLTPLEARRSAAPIPGGQEEEQLTSLETRKKRSLHLPAEEVQLASLEAGRSAALDPSTRKRCNPEPLESRRECSSEPATAKARLKHSLYIEDSFNTMTRVSNFN